jgi:maltose alpha-D-glucosyltransferase/alpha-amylase
MGDNIWLEDRNGVRTPMQWEAGATAGFSEAPVSSLYAPVIDDDLYGPGRINVSSQRSDPDSLLNTIRHMIGIRKSHRAFGRGAFDWVNVQNESIAAFQRSGQGETILAIHNLSATQQTLAPVMRAPAVSITDLLTGKEFRPVDGRLEIKLEPYQYLWLM